MRERCSACITAARGLRLGWSGCWQREVEADVKRAAGVGLRLGLELPAVLPGILPAILPVDWVAPGLLRVGLRLVRAGVLLWEWNGVMRSRYGLVHAGTPGVSLAGLGLRLWWLGF